MITCICIIKFNGEIIGYRLFDFESLKYKDVSKESCIRNIGSISNLEIINGNIVTTGSQDRLYPVFDRDKQKVYNSDKVVYVGYSDKIIEEEEDGSGNYTWKFWHPFAAIANYICKWNGDIQVIDSMDLQDLIINSKCLNVIEGYTGGEIEELQIDSLKSRCFCAIKSIYTRHKFLKKIEIMKFENKLYNVAKHKRVKKADTDKNRVVGVYGYGAVPDSEYGMCLSSIKDGYTKRKMPLYVEDKWVYYITPNATIEKEDIISYMAGGLAGVFNKLEVCSGKREASSCAISANKIFLLAINSLVVLDRDKYEEDIRDIISKKGTLSKKVQLFNASNIEADERGAVDRYIVKKDNETIYIARNMLEFDLANIDVEPNELLTKQGVVCVNITIPDDHNMVYMSKPFKKYIRCGVLECNDVKLSKLIIEQLLKKGNYDEVAKYNVTWRISSNNVTPALVQWVFKRNKVSLDIVGELDIKYKNKIAEQILNEYTVKNGLVEELSNFKEACYNLSICEVNMIYIGSMHMLYGYRYNRIDRLRTELMNRRVYGDTHYISKLGINKDSVMQSEQYMADGDESIRVRDNIGICIDVKLDKIVRTLKLLDKSQRMLNVYKSIDGEIDKKCKWLNKVYDENFKELAEDKQIASLSAFSSLQFGYAYKRSERAELKILITKDENGYINGYEYVKYVRYQLTDYDMKHLNGKEILGNRRVYSDTNKCSEKVKSHIADKLPDVLWVNLELSLNKINRRRKHLVTKSIEKIVASILDNTPYKLGIQIDNLRVADKKLLNTDTDGCVITEDSSLYKYMADIDDI